MFALFGTIAQLFALDLSNLLNWLYPVLPPLVDHFVSFGTTATNAINSGLDRVFG